MPTVECKNFKEMFRKLRRDPSLYICKCPEPNCSAQVGYSGFRIENSQIIGFGKIGFKSGELYCGELEGTYEHLSKFTKRASFAKTPEKLREAMILELERISSERERLK